MIKIGIVGAGEKEWTDEQKFLVKEKIRKIIGEHLKDGITLVSGHCHSGGVDIWAEEVADELGIKKEIYPAQVKRWSNIGCFKGYHSRNIQIAENCDVLYDIEPKSKRSGGTWTLEYLKKCGGKGYKIEI